LVARRNASPSCASRPRSDRNGEEGRPERRDRQQIREQQHRDRETALRENGFWIAQMLEAVRYGDDPKSLLRYDT